MDPITAVERDLDTRVSEQGHRLEDLDQAREFVFAGNARVRIVSATTGCAIDLAVARGKDKPEQQVRPPYFVRTNGTYAGCLQHSGRYTPERHGLVDTTTAAAIRWFLTGLRSRWTEALPAGLEVWHVGYCGRCNRLLRDPVSVETGFGPHCRKERAKLRTKRELLEQATDNGRSGAVDWRPDSALPEDFYAL